MIIYHYFLEANNQILNLVSFNTKAGILTDKQITNSVFQLDAFKHQRVGLDDIFGIEKYNKKLVYDQTQDEIYGELAKTLLIPSQNVLKYEFSSYRYVKTD